MSAKFYKSSIRKWFSYTLNHITVSITGWVFYNGVLCTPEALSRILVSFVLQEKDLEDVLRNLNGNFAIVVEAPLKFIALVDATRSIPLLYDQSAQSLRLSDDVNLLLSNPNRLDKDSLIEFSTAGYVTGSNTIYQQVKGLQSGEYLIWDKQSNELSTQRYFEYRCTYDNRDSLDDSCEKLDQVVLESFSDLVKTLNGRQAVLPLSGGLDSRLVASSLKRLGCDRILCFTYGRPGNFEAEKSRCIAEKLNLDWVEVRYTRQQWQEILQNQGMLAYWKMASNGVSMPHPDDWLAVKHLKEHGLVDDDAVFVPGHTGDFICGSHLKYIFDPVWHNNPRDFNQAMIKKHYSFWERLINQPDIRLRVSNRLNEVFISFSDETDEDLACRYEYWEWQERQSKFIINAVRVYEYFGYEWRIPLWSRQMMEFWKTIQIPWKVDKYLYRHYLFSYDPFGVFTEEKPEKPWSRQKALANLNQGFKSQIKAKLRNFPFVSHGLKQYLRFQAHFDEYKRHPIPLARSYGFWNQWLNFPDKRNAYAIYLKQVLECLYSVDSEALLRENES